MIKITNGYEVLTVTHNAYNEIFKRSGYRPYDAPPQKKEKPPEPKQYAKPISQWTKKELAEYMQKHGYKADGKLEHMREFVKHHMEDTE